MCSETPDVLTEATGSAILALTQITGCVLVKLTSSSDALMKVCVHPCVQGSDQEVKSGKTGKTLTFVHLKDNVLGDLLFGNAEKLHNL